MMNLKWLKDPDNISYVDANDFAEHFGKEIGVENLREKIKAFCRQSDQRRRSAERYKENQCEAVHSGSGI